MSDRLYTLNMCDFCSKEISTCQARPVFSRDLEVDSGKLLDPQSVVACDRYESPVDVLKKQFH